MDELKIDVDMKESEDVTVTSDVTVASDVTVTSEQNNDQESSCKQNEKEVIDDMVSDLQLLLGSKGVDNLTNSELPEAESSDLLSKLSEQI